MRTIRVAALQLRAHDRSAYARVREQMVQRIEAAANGCDLLVIPEGTFPAYVIGKEPVSPQDATRDVAALRDIARRTSTTIVAGIAMPHERATTNAAIAIDADGEVAGRADKVFLWHFDRQWFAPGDRIAAIDTSVGRIGVLVCADGRMPEIARALVDDGAQMLVMPTAWVTSGRNPQQLENVQADLLARVRAYENGVPFVAANKCGTELDMVAYCGKSQIVDRDGRILTIASEGSEECITAEVRLAGSTAHHADVTIAARSNSARSLRVALSVDQPADVATRMSILETDAWITPETSVPGDALQQCAALPVRDDDLLDPIVGIRARRTGYRTLLWHVSAPTDWTVTIARARALELRMYVLVFEARARAYAIDPDGTVVCGTFDTLRTASFAFDASRTAATLLAPGTDVDAGLAAVEALVRPSR